MPLLEELAQSWEKIPERGPFPHIPQALVILRVLGPATSFYKLWGLWLNIKFLSYFQDGRESLDDVTLGFLDWAESSWE